MPWPWPHAGQPQLPHRGALDASASAPLLPSDTPPRPPIRARLVPTSQDWEPDGPTRRQPALPQPVHTEACDRQVAPPLEQGRQPFGNDGSTDAGARSTDAAQNPSCGAPRGVGAAAPCVVSKKGRRGEEQARQLDWPLPGSCRSRPTQRRNRRGKAAAANKPAGCSRGGGGGGGATCTSFARHGRDRELPSAALKIKLYCSNHLRNCPQAVPSMRQQVCSCRGHLVATPCG
eukprot:364656-Chlamydomonas_euryale.AAC.3